VSRKSGQNIRYIPAVCYSGILSEIGRMTTKTAKTESQPRFSTPSNGWSPCAPIYRTGASKGCATAATTATSRAGERRMAGRNDDVPCILEPMGNSKTFLKNWARLIQKIYEVAPLPV
jgi:hypothetical protein